MKVELGNGVVLELVEIPAGSFLMGSPEDEEERFDDEGPQHLVRLESFWMGKYPVTQAQWRQVAGYPRVNHALNPDPSYFKGDNRPVENVSWDDAQEFCRRLSAKTNREYRLPSEAQWEYACRAGTTTPFHFGETLASDVANFDDSDSEGIFKECTTPVGSFPANPWGLHDMHGNVLEWCEDDWHGDYEGAPTDGSAWIDEPSTTTNRLLRGGSWYDIPRSCRSAFRNFSTRDYRSRYVGFRVVVLP